MNHKSGPGSKQVLLEHAMLARRSIWGRKCEFFLPRTLPELHSTVAHIQSSQYDAMVVVGGDGTQHQAIRGIRHFPNPVPLCTFPGGTANDLAHELGIHKDWEQAARILEKQKPELIDLIECNGVPFATVAGTGIGARLTREFNERRSSSKVFRMAA